MNKSIMTLALILCVGMISSCLSTEGGVDPTPIDKSLCTGSIDWKLLLNGPLQNLEQEPIGVALTLAVDSLVAGDTVPVWANITLEGLSVNEIVDSSDVGYVLVTQSKFRCESNLDSCWFSGISSNWGFYGAVYHYDSLPTSALGDGAHTEQTMMCYLDSIGGQEVTYQNDTAYDDGQYKFRYNAILVDTISDPAKRSPYKKWWPAPRVPWAKGESVWADSAIWGESPTLPKE